MRILLFGGARAAYASFSWIECYMPLFLRTSLPVDFNWAEIFGIWYVHA
jgi:hypothetical protein